MEGVAVVGVGMHPWGKFPDKTFVEMGVDACLKALEDANMQWTDIQEVVAGEWVWGGGQGFNPGPSIASMLGETGIPITNVFNMCATATDVFRAACNVVSSGQRDIVLAVSGDKSPNIF